MSDRLLKAEHLSKDFSGVVALDDVCLTIDSGRIYGLVGENGSGKSTLIKVLAGVLEPDSGEYYIDGLPRRSITPRDAIEAGIQVIYQDFALFPNLSVAENLAFNALVAGGARLVTHRRIYDLARDAQRRLGIALPLDATVDALSVAERQQVAIARALLQDARLIILDEPTTALTARETASLFALVRRLCKENDVAFLFVSHKLEEVLQLCEHVYVLRNGRLVADAPRSSFSQSLLVEHMTGRPAGAAGPPPAEPDEEILLQVEGLGRAGAFRDVSFTLRRGEILGIAGRLGSGRTELAEALFGLAPAERGRIMLGDAEVRIGGIEDALERGIAYVPEDRLTQGLFLERSVGDNLLVRISEMLRDALGLLSPDRRLAEAKRWIERVDIQPDDPHFPAQWLSGGNQQRLVLGKWLAAEPDLLILNGPTIGVDVRSKAALHRRLIDLARSGLSLIVISDDLPELVVLCHQVHVVQEGAVIARLDRPKLTEARLAELLSGDPSSSLNMDT